MRNQIDGTINLLEELCLSRLTAHNEEQPQAVGTINEQNKLLIKKMWDYYRSKPDLSAADVIWE